MAISWAAKGSRRAGDKHANAFATNATDALCTGKAFIQSPRSFTLGTVDLNIFITEGGRGGVREPMMLALRNGRDKIENRTGIRVNRMSHSG